MRLRPIRSTAKVRRKKMPVKLRASVSRAASRRVLPEIEEEEDDFEEYETREPNMKLSHAFIVVLILHLIAVGGIFGFNAMKNRQQTLAKIAAESGLVEAVPRAEERASRAAPQAAPAKSAPAAQADASAAGTPVETAAIATTHEVAPGDTLTRIAAKYETTIEALVNANQLADSAILRVGQKLVIPASGAVSTTARAAVPAAAPAAPAPKTAPDPAPKTAAASAAPAPKTAAASAPAPKAAAAPAAAAEGTVYEVVAGDNPYKIAKKFKVSYQALLDLNGITDPTKLQIGQKLKIPASQ